MKMSAFAVSLFVGVATVLAQAPGQWKDPSPHRVQFIEVQDSVRLETLDWGGTGRAVVLLAGSGLSGHVYDELGPKLTAFNHVYAITRRGYGNSSQPIGEYDEQRLADDILRVLDTLEIRSPVLAGHSMAGGEMTTLASRHPDRISALVYLDALGDPRDWPASDPAYVALFRALPPPKTPPPPRPTGAVSFGDFRAWQLKAEQFALPESELRSVYETNADGTMGRHRTPARIHQAIGEGQKRREYSKIRVPVLALIDYPRPRPEDSMPENEKDRAAVSAFLEATRKYVDRWIGNVLRGISGARIVDLQAGHYLFLTREKEVVYEIRTFIAGLPSPDARAGGAEMK
jgi:pimeloyl-ACP methyl ester carboxylesterase